MKPVLKALLIVVGLVSLLATGVVLYVIRTGLSAREESGAVETFVARRVRTMAIARRARNLTNPVERSPDVIADGRAHFADHCASCHANDGTGQTSMGKGMWPKPPDMRQHQTQALSDGELFWIIENGIRLTGMPGWGNLTRDSEEASWRLVHFIRHLPDVSTPELEQMQELNPASPAKIRERLEQEEFLKGGDPVPDAPAAPHSHRGGDDD